MLARRGRQWRGCSGCWRGGGRSRGCAAANGAGAAAAGGAGAVAADLGTALRAIGRGFGSGTFGLAQASAAMADKPTASARLVANAVDRRAAARTERVTVFLCGGESFNR